MGVKITRNEVLAWPGSRKIYRFEALNVKREAGRREA
jgi:hypothetical protein